MRRFWRSHAQHSDYVQQYWIIVNLSKTWEIVEDRGAWCVTVHGSQRVRHEQLYYSNNCIINTRLAKRLGLNYFPPKRKRYFCNMIKP